MAMFWWGFGTALFLVLVVRIVYVWLINLYGVQWYRVVDVKPMEADIPETAEMKFDKAALPMTEELANTVCEAENDPTNAIIWMFY